MPVRLFVCSRQEPMSWEDFRREKEDFSIALDGFVSAGPRFDHEKRQLNANHHEEVDRLATRSTCAQIFMCLKQGLFDLFQDSEGPKANVFVNDCDEDICCSWYLLNHSEKIKKSSKNCLIRLIEIEDKLDTTSGCFSIEDCSGGSIELLEQLAWIFEPYREFRRQGGLERKNDQEYSEIIFKVEERIKDHILGHGKKIKLDTRYEIYSENEKWKMIKETGRDAKIGYISDGIHSYVTFREKGDGTYIYTIGKISPFVDFDIEKIYKELNKIDSSSNDRWGGSSLCGGSPRVKGSQIHPNEIVKIINTTLSKK